MLPTAVAAGMQVQVGGGPAYKVVLDQRLGKGGFGQVYKGERASHRSPAASAKCAAPAEVRGPTLLGRKLIWTLTLLSHASAEISVH